MNSVKGLKQLLVEKGVAAADTVKSFSKLKEMVNKAHAMRIPLDEEYQDGPRRAIRKVYCSTNSISGYEVNSTRAGLNAMTNFTNKLPNLKSVQKIESTTELACVGLMVPIADCQSRDTCTCQGRVDCGCNRDCGGNFAGCNCRHRCSCTSQNPDCLSRTTCTCYTVAVADDVKLCTCHNVTTY